jgi:hypothetical protein
MVSIVTAQLTTVGTAGLKFVRYDSVMINSAFPASTSPAAPVLPCDGVGVATSITSVGTAAHARQMTRHRCAVQKSDPRFQPGSGSSEMQRMALVAALSVLIAGCSMVPEGRGLSRAPSAPAVRTAAIPALPGPPTADTRQCISALSKAQVRFTPVPDQTFGAGCSQLGSVRLSTIALTDAPRGYNELAVSNIGPVRCELAQRFAGWAQFGVARAAEQMLGSPLVKIETMGSYSCRTIAGSAKLSQHAHANAIDIAAFVLADGRRISVKQGWAGSNQERAFLRTIHASACKRFGTVLGPDYNAAHQDHLHVDMSGQGYCR